jgi:hypothetical protein
MNNAEMRTTLNRVGFSEAAAQAKVEDQGINSLNEIKLMTDDDVESLCKIVSRPEGTIPAVGGAPGAAAVQNPGVSINQHAEGHSKSPVFLLKSSSLCEPQCYSSRYHTQNHFFRTQLMRLRADLQGADNQRK